MFPTSGSESAYRSAETAAETPADETAEEAAPEFKVGDVVVPSKGPHKGEKHEVIRVRDDGRIDIKPQGIEGEAVKYRNGGATAKPEDLVLAEGYAAQFKGFKLFKQGSLLTQVSVDLVEATDAKTMSKAKDRIREITKEMDAIIDGGGRVLENDPLMQELRALRRKISSLKKVSEAVKSTADDLDEKHEKWKSDVLAAHPDVAAKIKFKSRIEQDAKDTRAFCLERRPQFRLRPASHLGDRFQRQEHRTVGKVGPGHDVLDPVERQDEHLEISQVFHKGDVGDRVVAQVKRLQPDAVAQKVKVSACVSL